MLTNGYQMVCSLLNERAKSKSQQRFFGMVYATKTGKLKNPSPDVKAAAKSISKKEARKYAKTKHANLPEKV
jgi:hypothetical protein